MKPKPMKAEGQNMLLAARFGIDQLIRALRLKAPGIMGWGLKHRHFLRLEGRISVMLHARARILWSFMKLYKTKRNTTIFNENIQKPKESSTLRFSCCVFACFLLGKTGNRRAGSRK